MLTYGFAADCDIVVGNYRTKGVASLFDVTFPDGRVASCTLPKNPGRHNALNAAGVLGVIYALGEDVEAAAVGLERYSGVRRRFDLVGDACDITVVDDYAHHPTEIKATLAAARDLDFSRVMVLFQPHRYSRTQSLAAEFGEAFDAADCVVVADVYAAGEAPIEGVSGNTIVQAIEEHGATLAVYAPTKDEAIAAMAGMVRPGDLVFTMGAGDVTTFGPVLLEEVRKGEDARRDA